jgi:hypothetical protein
LSRCTGAGRALSELVDSSPPVELEPLSKTVELPVLPLGAEVIGGDVMSRSCSMRSRKADKRSRTRMSGSGTC